MNKIIIKLFGNPIVTYKNENIHFPYKKVEGLFYYICVNKTITRDEAISLLWLDNNESLAKKNLRDALYKIRKIFGENIFLKTKKSDISINNDIIEIDIDKVSEDNINKLYVGNFLSNFIIKDNNEFNDWITSKRNEYKSKFIKKINYLLNEMISIRDYNRINYYANILVSNDPYNEKVYRDIMKIHALNGNYNMAVKIYSDLCKILKEELDTTPEKNTFKMYREILSLKNSEDDKDKTQNYFYGRFDEIYCVTNTIDNFYYDLATSIVLTGEAGIGKSSFLNKINTLIDTNRFIVINTSCYNAEQNYFLKPWNNVFKHLGKYIKKNKITISDTAQQSISYLFPSFNKKISTENLNITNNLSSLSHTELIDTTKYQIAYEYIIDLLLKVSSNKKIILLFDDIQWMDKMSKNLLKNILFKLGKTHILMIGTYRNDYEDKLNSLTVDLFSKELLQEIKLKRFDKSEVQAIVEHLTPSIKNNIDIMNKIYSDTEGNALFLTELLKTIKEKGYTKELSLKATSIIKSRIIDLSSKEHDLLNVLSMYFDKTDIKGLTYILNCDEFSLYETVEKLKSKHLILETLTKSNIYYCFTHQKIREYVYNNQSLGKKRLLHNKIALYLENKYIETKNINLFSKLIYHYSQGNNMGKALEYKLVYLKEYYTIYHENYPILSFDYNTIKNNKTSKSFDINQLINQIETLPNKNETEYLKLKMEITFIIGRLNIANGEYVNGINNISTSKDIALLLKDKVYILENYKQFIFYCIQVNDLIQMKLYIEKIIEIIGLDDINEEVGTILRLYGLYYIKNKKYDKAKILLFKSIDIFTKLNNTSNNKFNYLLSIAAGYNYLGQLYKYIFDYTEAYKYFVKAIDICSTDSITSGIGIFYSNAGQALYKMNNIDKAKKYIDKSLDYFNATNAIWGRDIAECYACLINLEISNTKEAITHYNNANKICNKIKNPITQQILNDIKNNTEIKNIINE